METQNIMTTLEKTLTKFPMTSVITFVIICISAIVFIPPLFISVDKPFDKDIAHSIIQLMLSGFVLSIIYKCKWINKIGLTTRMKQWPSRWWIAAIPMSLLAILNLISIDSSLLVFDIEKLISWIFVNFTTGIFEELLLRGLCFYLLFTAWQHKSNALYKAAIAQAIIFGLAHIVNLTVADPLDVYAQVVYATLFGIGFAGLLAYTKSLWLPICIHTLINAASGFGFYFIPNLVLDHVDVSSYVAGIIVISILCAIPGLFLLKSANKKLVSRES
jgi:membrane protease YdiL (CAAX protease family)